MSCYTVTMETLTEHCAPRLRLLGRILASSPAGVLRLLDSQ